MAKGLFHHQAGPLAVLVQFGLAQFPGHWLNHPGWQTQVKDAVGLNPPSFILVRQFLGQFAEHFGFIQVRRHKVQVGSKPLPLLLHGFPPAGKSIHPFFEMLLEFLVGHVPVAGADDQKLLRQPLVQVKII